MANTLVFDLDGTLADTARDLIPALNRVISIDGLAPVALAEIGHVVGHGSKVMIERAHQLRGRNVSPERLDYLFGRFLDVYMENIADHTVLFEGTGAAMNRFADAGWKLAICTNKPIAMTRLLLAKLGVADRFASVSGGDSFAFKKPDPRHLTETIRLAGGFPGKSVMVGDSITDIQTARAAGVPVVAVNFGYSAEPVAALGPDRVIGHFDELWEAVASLYAPAV
jgi:phosphoglycolate phosphatase